MIASAVRASRTWCARLSVLAAVLVSLSPARADAVMQSDGTPIPVLNGTTCEGHAGHCINDNELAEGGDPLDVIDASATATVSQETFSPLCELTFKVVARGAGYKNTFGWYAVQRDAKGDALAPMLGDLHVFLGCDDAIGVEKRLSIPAGVGEIGFFLANDEYTCVSTVPDPLGPVLAEQPSNLFFSQRAFNSDGDGLIHLLVWQSHANPNAFYFGWEDLKGGGDNDFEDLLTYVTGIQCAGGGEPCQIDGAKGVCADGVMQCRDGKLTCVATQTSSEEVCNGLDDNCSEEIDEGDDLCPKDEICVRGRCEPKCGTGEFRCGADEMCVEGVCIDAACAKVKCDAPGVCRGGECVAPCDDVTCPYGQSCRSGVCVDVCAGVECDPGFVCEARASSDAETVIGVCTSCDCRGCDDGQSCVAHLCVDDSCVDQTCDASAHCSDGKCIDNCQDAACPAGQLCEAGACIKDPKSGGGGAASGEGGNGATGNDGGIDFNPGNDGGSDAEGGAPSGSGQLGDKVAIEAKGCSCSTPGGNASALGTLGLLGLLLGAARRRAARGARCAARG